MEAFKDRLKDLREEKELSQSKLAILLDIGQGNVSRWENGTQEPTASNIIKLSRFFGVTTDYLLGEEN